MNWIFEPNAWAALASLTALEIVLGIDNVVFISILVSKLPKVHQDKARLIGLALAMLARIALLFSLTWMMKLTAPLFVVLKHPISGRDLILIIGGLFLLAKSTHEIHDKLEGEGKSGEKALKATFASVMVQVVILDVVFSLDSVITAIGMAEQIGVMVTAVMIAIGFMMVFAKSINTFVDQHPTIKMLALAFLLLIGVSLVADGIGHHIPKGYIYFSMAFSIFVEMLNLKVRKKRVAPLKLRKSLETES